MTKYLRRAGLLTLAMLVASLSIVSMAFAQDQPNTCYPVPPGGCVEGEVQCEEIIAAIEAGELDADALPAECDEDVSVAEDCDDVIAAIQAGDRDPADLPAGCELPEPEVDCDTLIEEILAGDGDPSDLPAECEDDLDCDDVIAAVEAGDLAVEDVPEVCIELVVQAQEDEDDGEVAVLAETGLATGALAVTGLFGLLSGLMLLRVGRRS